MRQDEGEEDDFNIVIPVIDEEGNVYESSSQRIMTAETQTGNNSTVRNLINEFEAHLLQRMSVQNREEFRKADTSRPTREIERGCCLTL